MSYYFGCVTWVIRDSGSGRTSYFQELELSGVISLLWFPW